MDVSERYYCVYQFCLSQTRHPEQSVTVLPKAEFWRLKRARVPEREIGRRSGLDEVQARAFAQLRRKTVHTLPYLGYDSLVPGAIDTLRQIQQLQIDLAVMTMRRTRELEDAFERYSLGQFFPLDRRYCLSNDYVKTADVEDKPRLMEQALAELPPACDTWMVGDTEADMVAAKNYGVKAIAVLSGIRDREQLMQHSPDWIVPDFASALTLILQQTPEPVAGRNPSFSESSSCHAG